MPLSSLTMGPTLRWLARTAAALAVISVGTAAGPSALHVASPEPALAQLYPVYVCGAPAQNHALQFSDSTDHILSAQMCGGNGIQVWSHDSASGGQAGGWWFHAPPGTTIASLYANYKLSGWGGWVAHWATQENGAGDPYSGSDCASTNCNAETNGFDWYAGVANTSELGFGIWCHANTCPANDSQSWYGPAASANVYDATIEVNDPAPPTFSDPGGTLTARPAWISAANAPSGGWYLVSQASDPGGVCGFNVSVGSEQATGNVGADYTQATPCGISPRSVDFTLNPCALPDGSYTLSEYASNPANMVGYGPYNGETINIDCTPPSTGIATAPSSTRWYSTAQSVVFTGSDNFSGVSGLSCNDGWHGGSSYTETLSAQGTDTASCTAVDNASNVGNNESASVHIDYQSPTVSFSGASQSGWLSGPQTLTVTGAEAQALSGIASVSCSVDGGAPQVADAASEQLVIRNDGTHIVSCSATTSAGVTGPAANYAVHVDSQAPTLAFSGGPPQGRWATTSQSITVTAQDQPGLSGVKQIACSVGSDSSTYPGSQAQITVPPPGGELTCKAQDNAGNVSASEAWNFLIDDTPPTGRFLQPDPGNPTRVAALLADTGSGVAGARLEIQAASGWQALPTSWDPSSGIASATIPDDGSLADGTYDLHVLAWDVAGNQATITQAAGGGPDTITLPIRIATDMRVADAIATSRRCTTVREAIDARPGDQLRRGRAAIPSRLRRACRPVPAPHGAVIARIAYGQQQIVHGQLTTLDGSPIPYAPVNVDASEAGWPTRSLPTVTTNADGDFTDTLAGSSETVTFSYAGTSTLRYSAGKTMLLVIGKARINVGRGAQAGRSLKITGHVFGGYVPRGGVLVQLQYRIRGVPVGWAPFHALIHTNRRGLFATRFPVSRGARGYTYLLRATIDQQSGWPFETTTSNVVARRVR